MKNITKISKRVIISTLVFSILCSGLIYILDVSAVSAERGDFVVLGRSELNDAGEEVFVEEAISLYEQPGPSVGMPYLKLNSGITVQVLQSVTIAKIVYYNVSTVGPEGGIMGWVTEEYIYEIVPEPNME
jgi:hypothetical protein